MSQHKTGSGYKKPDELKKYYMLGFPLLGLMALIGVAGIVATVAARYFFSSP